MCKISLCRISSASIRSNFKDPILNIGSTRSDGPISRFRFCGENVGRSFAVCSHNPISRSDKESSILVPKRSQGHHAKFIGAFHLSRKVLEKIDHALFPSVFFKITDPCVGRSFLMRSHDPIFNLNKTRILKNGSCERAYGDFWPFGTNSASPLEY